MENKKIFCLLGQNGAGKSTTINLLTGLHPASHGHAWFQGQSIHTEMANIQTQMGICPQDHVYFSELTGRQHIRFWAIFKGYTK
jgi:ABC-type multidrug transport system ATPase subunit